jgi:acyl-CoA synthetase (NDP forming)
MSEPLSRDLVAVAETTDKPIFVVWGSPVGTERPYTDILLRSQLPVFRTFQNCVTAVKAYLDYWKFADRYRSPFDEVPTIPADGAAKARRVLDRAAPGTALSEHASKRLLAAYGIRSTREVLCGSAKEAVEAAQRIGLPVVMKVSSPDLLHKSDAGLVEVGVDTVTGVRSTFRDLLQRAERADRHATIEGVLASQLVSGGVETMVGLSQDPLFGPVVTVGLGGIFVEVLGDVSHRVPPFGRDEAERMVRELAGFPLLEGARGRKPADLDALLDVIMAVQRIGLDLGDDVAELDINPLVVKPQGAVALDALVVRREASKEEESS